MKLLYQVEPVGHQIASKTDSQLQQNSVDDDINWIQHQDQLGFRWVKRHQIHLQLTKRTKIEFNQTESNLNELKEWIEHLVIELAPLPNGVGLTRFKWNKRQIGNKRQKLVKSWFA